MDIIRPRVVLLLLLLISHGAHSQVVGVVRGVGLGANLGAGLLNFAGVAASGLGALAFAPTYFGFCSDGGIYIAGVCQSPRGLPSDAYAAAGGLAGAFGNFFGSCNSPTLIYINGVCAPTADFAYNPYAYTALNVVTQSLGFGVTGRRHLAAVLLPGRLPTAPQAAPPPQSSTAGTAPRNVSDALEALFAAPQRCPLLSSPSLASALADVASRCAAAPDTELCAACVGGAEAALADAAWATLPALPRGALAPPPVQAACGRAVVDALAARGVPLPRLRAAGAACGSYASRPQCADAGLPVAARPLLLSCRDALSAAVAPVAAPRDDAAAAAAAFDATSERFCAACFWPALSLALASGGCSNASTADDAAASMQLLSGAPFNACARNMQALSRDALGGDLLVDPRAAAHASRCWEARFQPPGGGAKALRDAASRGCSPR